MRITSTLCSFRHLLLTAAVALLPAVAVADDASPGFVKTAERPETTPPAVQWQNGWLVPYDEAIPGTDISFRMVPIPGGTFRLGSPADEVGRDEIEGPQVEVTLPPF